MPLPDQFIDAIATTAEHERRAATKTMRHTRARLNASTDDLRIVLRALFAEVIS